MKEIVIYNPACIDSVISAATLKDARQCRASSLNNLHLSDLLKYDMVWAVGIQIPEKVQETVQTISYLLERDHTEDPITMVKMEHLRAAKDETNLTDSYLDLISKDVRSVENRVCKDLSRYKYLLQHVGSYITGIEFAQVSMLFKLHNSALISIMNNEPFTFELIDDAAVRDSYRRFLTETKIALTNNSFTKEVGLKKTFLGIPYRTIRKRSILFINESLDKAPWFGRLVAKGHHALIIFEHGKDGKVKYAMQAFTDDGKYAINQLLADAGKVF